MKRSPTSAHTKRTAEQKESQGHSLHAEVSEEGIEGGMFLDAYMTMQRYAGVPGGRSFDALYNASRAMGVVMVPRYMKEAFALELRLRTQLAFEAQNGMKVPEALEKWQRKARESKTVPSGGNV